MLLSTSIVIPAFNTVVNATNMLTFTVAGSNPLYISPSFMNVGLALYTVGMLSETIAEVRARTSKTIRKRKGNHTVVDCLDWQDTLTMGHMLYGARDSH
jgi:hypothetical protein